MTSRRDFLLRAGQTAAALSFASPALGRIIDSAAYAESNGMVRTAPPLDISSIAHGLRWRGFLAGQMSSTSAR